MNKPNETKHMTPVREDENNASIIVRLNLIE